MATATAMYRQQRNASASFMIFDRAATRLHNEAATIDARMRSLHVDIKPLPDDQRGGGQTETYDASYGMTTQRGPDRHSSLRSRRTTMRSFRVRYRPLILIGIGVPENGASDVPGRWALIWRWGSLVFPELPTRAILSPIRNCCPTRTWMEPF